MDRDLPVKKEGTLNDYFDKEQQKVLKSLPDNQREALIELGKTSGEEHEKLLQKIAEDEDLFPGFDVYEDVFSRMGWA